jgi:hypothetical protein
MEGHYSECRVFLYFYVECQCAGIVMLNVVMQTVVMLTVVVTNRIIYFLFKSLAFLLLIS